MNLEESALCGAHYASGLGAVQHAIAISTLQAHADPLGHPVGQWRDHQHSDPQRLGDLVDGQPQLDGNQVIAGRYEQDQVEADGHGTQAGAGRGVAWTIQEVMFAPVACDPGLEEWVDPGDGVEQRHHHQGGNEHVQAEGMPEEIELEEAGKQPQRPVGETHVPVGL